MQLSNILLQIAASQLGVKHNSAIVRYAQEVGLDWINDDKTSWCSIFLNWCAWRTGLERSGSHWAKSWLEVGEPVALRLARPGHILVFSRRASNAPAGHVGLYLGHTGMGNTCNVLGGGQDGEVGIEVLHLNWLTPGGVRSLGFADPVPSTPIHFGEKGEHVKQLQRLLRRLNHPCGRADGVFGEKTAAALEKAQERAYGLDLVATILPLGVYGTSAAKALRGLLEFQHQRTAA